jgi:EAL domain-containing protein (putative c-di-GMP-specific phosphodiesterase class I)
MGRGAELEVTAIGAALAQLDRLPADAFLAVNASPATASTPELDSVLARYPAERIVLELTEHTRVADYDTLLVALDHLRDRGVRIAVDDTGAGYAGFQHLLRLRPEILKLDTTLTRGIDADPVRRALAAALVTFAAEIDATIIAEGIEITGELATLGHLGIPWGQGYHLARPAALPLPALRLATLTAPSP